VPFTAGDWFAWAERTHPALFPAGPQTQSVLYAFRSYQVRDYPQQDVRESAAPAVCMAPDGRMAVLDVPRSIDRTPAQAPATTLSASPGQTRWLPLANQGTNPCHTPSSTPSVSTTPGLSATATRPAFQRARNWCWSQGSMVREQTAA